MTTITTVTTVTTVVCIDCNGILSKADVKAKSKRCRKCVTQRRYDTCAKLREEAISKPPPEAKKCTRCKTILPIKWFKEDSKDKYSTDGFGVVCTLCGYTYGAKQRKYNWNLTFEQAVGLLFQARCWYCGDKYDKLGIDRIDNNTGYEPNNVVSCCTMCNRIKNNYDLEILNKHLSKMVFHKIYKDIMGNL